MKNTIYKCLIKTFFICLFLFLILFTTGCITASVVIINKRISSSFYDNVVNVIKKEPIVKDVKVWSTDGNIVTRYFDMEVEFYNGGNIWAFDINQWGKEDEKKPMNINIINDYRITFFNKSKKDFIFFKDLNIWSEVIGVELGSIVDIIKNYHIISEHVINWTNLSDYKKDNDIFIQTIYNIIVNDYYGDTTMFNEDEILLLKYDKGTKWKFPTNEELLNVRKLLYEYKDIEFNRM